MSNETDIQSLEDVSAINAVTAEEYEKAKAAGITSLRTLTVTYDHYMAELTIRTWWGSNGGILYGYTEQYRVSSNGNTNGNLTFGVHGTQGQSWQHELTGSAVQDGKWHDIKNGGYVGCPLATGWLYFKFVFDRSGTWDPAADTRLDVAYP